MGSSAYQITNKKLPHKSKDKEETVIDENEIEAKKNKFRDFLKLWGA